MSRIVVDTRPICSEPRKPWPAPEYVCELHKRHKGRHEAVSVKNSMTGEIVSWPRARGGEHHA